MGDKCAKQGRNKATCDRYRREERAEKNKALKLIRYLSRCEDHVRDGRKGGSQQDAIVALSKLAKHNVEWARRTLTEARGR